MRKQFLLVMLATAAFGLSRLVFNYAAIHAVDPAFAGQVNSLISLITVTLAFVAQPIAATVNRFAPRYLAEGRVEEASRLLSVSTLSTLGMTGMLFILLVVLAPHVGAILSIELGDWYVPTAVYTFGYAFYFLFKLAYFGHGRSMKYVRTELAAAGLLCLFITIAFQKGSPTWFALALIVHPIVFSALAARDLRDCFVWRPVAGMRNTLNGEYLRYATLWLAASASGLAAYHGSVLVLSIGGAPTGTVGYYALCLSLIAPLSVVPSILSQVVFPRLAANSAVGAEASNLNIIRAMTSMLIVALIVGLAVICGCAPWILRNVGIVPSAAWIAVVQLLAIGTSVSLLSTPCGNYLFADSYAKPAAVIGACSVLVGLIVWGLAVPRLGAVGAALGYAILMTVRGVANMLVVNHYARWQVGFPWKWAVALAYVGLMCGLAYAAVPEVTRTMVVAVAIMGILLLFAQEIRNTVTGRPLQDDACAWGRPLDS